MKTGEDSFTANKENIELNFDTVKEAESTETVCPAEGREFKFARPKCPVGGRKTSEHNLPGRSLSEPSPLVTEHFNSKCLNFNSHPLFYL